MDAWRSVFVCHEAGKCYTDDYLFAAVSFFREFLDGGFGENNPSWVAYDEVRQMHRASPELILSMGTGKPADQDGTPNRRRRRADWMENIKTLTFLATNSEKEHRRMTVRSQEQEKLSYYRLNVPYYSDREKNMKDILLDEWEPKPRTTRDSFNPFGTDTSEPGLTTKNKIRDLTMDYLSRWEVNRDLLDCAWQLVLLRRNRAAQTPQSQWEQFACRFVYRCPEGF